MVKDGQLPQSESLYRVLFEESPLAILLFDTESLRILAVNRAASRLYGYSTEEFLALRMHDLKRAQDMHEIIHEVQGRHPPTGPGAPWRGTRKHTKKDGTLFDIEIVAHPVIIEGRRAQLAIGNDVTDQRKLEEQLRHSQKMDAIGRLAGGVAHDFNNMLAVILSNVTCMREELGDDHRVADDLEQVESAAKRGAALVSQLLAFSRRDRTNPAVLALNTVVTDMERMLRRLINEDVDLTLALEPNLGAVRADAGQVEQVIMNLVVNARDAMSERGGGGQLAIRTENVEVTAEDSLRLSNIPPGPYVVIEVNDTGVGMDAATMVRIFEPFFTTKELGSGTGLGLSTVFGIVKAAGGAIEVASTPGAGSKFRVYLPRVDELPMQSSPAPSPRAPTVGGERVLLVEDDPDVRRVVARILRRRGYIVIEAKDGDDAVARFDAPSPPADLVLSDVVMPGVDGFGVAKRLRERHPDVPILLMSGYAEHAAFRHGDVDHPLLRKPFDADQLALAVRAMLDGAKKKISERAPKESAG